jgi:hypothetical protein
MSVTTDLTVEIKSEDPETGSNPFIHYMTDVISFTNPVAFFRITSGQPGGTDIPGYIPAKAVILHNTSAYNVIFVMAAFKHDYETPGFAYGTVNQGEFPLLGGEFIILPFIQGSMPLGQGSIGYITPTSYDDPNHADEVNHAAVDVIYY